MKDSLKHAARNRQAFVRDQPAIAALVAWVHITALQALANLHPIGYQAAQNARERGNHGDIPRIRHNLTFLNMVAYGRNAAEFAIARGAQHALAGEPPTKPGTAVFGNADPS